MASSLTHRCCPGAGHRPCPRPAAQAQHCPNPKPQPGRRKGLVLLAHLGKIRSSSHEDPCWLYAPNSKKAFLNITFKMALWAFQACLEEKLKKPVHHFNICIHSEETGLLNSSNKKIGSYIQTEMKVVVLASIRQRRLCLKLISRDTGSNVCVNEITYFIGLPSAMAFKSMIWQNKKITL